MMPYWDGRVGALPPLSQSERDAAKQRYQAVIAAMPEIIDSARYRAGQSGAAVTFERLVRILGTYDHVTTCRIAAFSVLQLATRAEAST